jgi:hypothetical protein
MRTIVDAVQKTMTNGYGIENVEFPFDPEFVSVEDFPSLKPCLGGFLNPLLIISEFLLMIKEEDIILSPTVEVTKEGDPYISNYTSGAIYRVLCEKVTRHYGPGVYPMVFDWNFDSMALDILGKNSLKPWKLRLKNVVNSLVEKQSNIITCAYGPIFQHTAAELKRMLAHNIEYPSKLPEALVYLRR